MTTPFSEWIIPGTGATVLNGGSAMTERARLRTQVDGCCPTGPTKVYTGNVSCCVAPRFGNSVRGEIVPPPSVYLDDTLRGCSGGSSGPLSAAQARALLQQSRSRAKVQTEEGLLLNKVATLIENSTSPLSTSTRFVAYAGPVIPPGCAPTPPPPTNYIPTKCPPPPGSKGF
jgi:hypothetical protein